MKKFHIMCVSVVKKTYVIMHNSYYARCSYAVTHDNLKKWYNVEKNIALEYNCDIECNTVLFKSIHDAQNFLNNILIPYEIAFNLGG